MCVRCLNCNCEYEEDYLVMQFEDGRDVLVCPVCKTAKHLIDLDEYEGRI
ncbi:hypothetical protein [Cetobacterium sp.]